MAEHPGHSHDHDDGHAHGHHHHDHALPVVEEPLDPATQSLSDALKSSFRVLKAIMVVVVILFLFSGVFQVQQNEVVVLSRFGHMLEPRQPGLHLAWPYPVDQKFRVPTAPVTIEISDFWLRISEEDRKKELSELPIQGNELDPATDGAVLTGDRAIMHLNLRVVYRIEKPRDFVKNVGSDQVDRLLPGVIRNAIVAESARVSADDLFYHAEDLLVPEIRRRAQETLTALDTGIRIESMLTTHRFYPLQVREEFNSVAKAQARQRELEQEAIREREKILKGAAGAAWEAINEQIDRLDQIEDDEDARQDIFRRINEILENDAKGEAGGRIQLARGESEQIVAATQARAVLFERLLKPYQDNPSLVKAGLLQREIRRIFQGTDERPVLWQLPGGDNELILLLNTDPVQIREAERRAMEKQTKP